MDMLAPPVQTNPVADVIAQMAAGASAGTGSGGEGGGQEAIAIGGGGSGGGAHTLQEWFDCSGRDLGLRRILLTLLTLAG